MTLIVVGCVVSAVSLLGLAAALRKSACLLFVVSRHYFGALVLKCFLSGVKHVT